MPAAAATATARQDRMAAMRDGCRAAIEAQHAEGRLAPGWTRRRTTDGLCTLLLVANQEVRTVACGWSTKGWARGMELLAERNFVAEEAS